jgi:Mg2+ and Co2+ transporter CorA
MNVKLPGQSSPLAFVWLIAVSSAIALAVVWFFWRRRWL